MQKRVIAAFVLGLALIASRSFAKEAEDVAKAQKVATAWLTLMDAGKYGEGWDAAAAMFKNAIPRGNWDAASKSARGPSGPLGALKGRKLKSASFTRTAPGAPPGEYVIVLFNAQFERRPAGIEQITVAHEKDGSWKVAGYAIH